MAEIVDIQPLFDEAFIVDIEPSLSPGDFRALLSDYLVSAADRLERMRRMTTTGDLRELADEAHTMISMTGSYGLTRASVLARQLVTACRSNDRAAAAAVLPLLIDATDRGCTSMRNRFLVSAV